MFNVKQFYRALFHLKELKKSSMENASGRLSSDLFIFSICQNLIKHAYHAAYLICCIAVIIQLQFSFKLFLSLVSSNYGIGAIGSPSSSFSIISNSFSSLHSSGVNSRSFCSGIGGGGFGGLISIFLNASLLRYV